MCKCTRYMYIHVFMQIVHVTHKHTHTQQYNNSQLSVEDTFRRAREFAAEHIPHLSHATPPAIMLAVLVT